MVAAAILVLSTFLAYAPAILGGFIWNDRDYVTAPALRTWSGLLRIWTDLGITEQYYPVLHSAFWLEYRLWGPNPLGYHVVNVALHAIAAILLGAVMRELRLPGRWLAALLFALHPVCVESVAWIAEQKNTLSTVFYLAAAVCYLRFDETRSRHAYAWGTGLFVLALLTKSVTATLAPALLVLAWWRRGHLTWRRDVLPIAPWFVMGAAMGLFSGWVERTFVGAEGADFQLSGLERTLIAGRAAWFYFGKLLWPANLTFIYPRWTVAPTDTAWYVGLAGVIILVMLLWKLRVHTRGPLASVLCYGGGLVPTLGFFDIYAFKFSFVADHWQYMPVLAILALTGYGLARASTALNRQQPMLGTVLIGLLMTGLGGVTFQQSRIYRDLETFYRVTIVRNPACWMAHGNLGQLLASRGEIDQAIGHLREAIRLRPGHAEAHNNLGLLLARAPGGLEAALEHFRRALESEPLPEVHNNIAVELAKLPGRSEEAIAHFRRALQLKPNHAQVHYNLASELAKDPARQAEALRHLELAVRSDPDFAAARGNLANLLAEIPDRLPEAIHHYEEALRLRPGVALVHNNLANALARMPGRIPDAIQHYFRALEIEPRSAAIHYNLAHQLALLPDRRNEALRHFQVAAQLEPGFALAHLHLGKQLARIPGRQREAMNALQTAFRLDPTLEEAQAEAARLQAQSDPLDRNPRGLQPR